MDIEKASTKEEDQGAPMVTKPRIDPMALPSERIIQTLAEATQSALRKIDMKNPMALPLPLEDIKQILAEAEARALRKI